MLNKLLLKAKMVEHGYTNESMAREIGITSRTFSNRLRSGEFGSTEIKIMIDKLEITDPMPIFLLRKQLISYQKAITSNHSFERW